MYLRRKPHAECFNPDELIMVKQLKVCPCETDDWECDSGYTRNQSTNKCEASNPRVISEPPEQCEDYFFTKTGYRKIAGNLCEGGVDLGPQRTLCPDRFRKSMIYMGLAIVLLLFIAYKVKQRAHDDFERRRLGRNDSESYPGFDHEKIQ